MIRSRKCRRASLEQVGDVFRLTVPETGEVVDFENPIEAKRRYDDFLTDDRTFGDEIEREGFDRYTGGKRS